MNAHDRKEFVYDPNLTIATGVGFSVIGIAFIWVDLGSILGLINVGVKVHVFNDIHVATGTEKLAVLYFGLFLGLVFASAGVWVLSKGFDRRPVIVMDSEGLFYRPHGSIIPWPDIRTVEVDTRGRIARIILHQLNGPPVMMDMQWLKYSAVYEAIMQARQGYGHPPG